MPTIEEFMKQYGGGAQKQPEQQPVQQTEPVQEQQPRRTVADFMNQYGGDAYKQSSYQSAPISAPAVQRPAQTQYVPQFRNANMEQAYNEVQNQLQQYRNTGRDFDSYYQRADAIYQNAQRDLAAKRDEYQQLQADVGKEHYWTENGYQEYTPEQMQQKRDELARLGAELEAGEQEVQRLRYISDFAGRSRYDDLREHQDYDRNVEAGKKILAQFVQDQNATQGRKRASSESGFTGIGSAEDYYAPRTPDERWTEQERNNYLYFLGKNQNDPAAAYQYAMELNDAYNMAQANEKLDPVREAGRNADNFFTAQGQDFNGLVGTIASIPSGLVNQGRNYWEYLASGHVSPRADPSLRDYVNAYNQGNQERMNEEYGTLGEEWGFLSGKGLGDVNALANSMAESATLAGIAKGTMALGGSEKLAKGLTGAAFFGNAADQTTQEALRRGATSGQALALGTLAGIAEVAGEELSIDNFIHMNDPVGAKQILLAIAKQGGVEATEEGNTTLLNTYFDHLVMGDKSELSAKIDDYIADGMTRSEAEKKAWTEWTSDIATDMLGGLLSGGALGSLNVASTKLRNTVETNRANAQTQQQKNLVLMLDSCKTDADYVTMMERITGDRKLAQTFRDFYRTEPSVVLDEMRAEAEQNAQEEQPVQQSPSEAAESSLPQGGIPAPAEGAEAPTAQAQEFNLQPKENVSEPSQLNIDNTAEQGYNISIKDGTEGVSNDQRGSAEEAGRGVAPGEGSLGASAQLGQAAGEGPGVHGVVRLSEDLNNAYQKSGVTPASMENRTGDNAAYSFALDAAREADPVNGWAVTPQKPGDLQGKLLYMAPDSSSGVVVTTDGDIEGVFRNKQTGKPGALDTLLPLAVENGGTKLDCYGDLVHQYARYGFVPVARVEFNEEYANPGWDESKGRPDVIVMMHDGSTPAQMIENKQSGNYHRYTDAEIEALPFYDKNSYDDAIAYRDGLLAKQQAGKVGETGLAVRENNAPQERIATPPAEARNDSGIAGPGGTEQSGPQPGMKRSQTESHTLQHMADVTGGQQEELYYVPKTERESLTNAMNRVRSDMNGEMQKLMDKEMWNGEDIDTGLSIMGLLQMDGVRTNDFSAAQAWSRIVQARGTESGRALQAFSKWTRSGVAAATQSMNALTEAKNLSEEQKTQITNDVYQFAQEYDGIEDGDLKSIRELIKKQAKYRNTWTFGKKGFGKYLNEITDFDWLKEYAMRQMMNISADFTEEADLGQKAKTWQVNAQLSRLGTFFRNIGGNGVFGVQDTLSQDFFGVALDALIGKKTGKRTVAADKGWLSSEARKGARQGLLRSMLEVAGDVDMGAGGSKYGQGSNRTFKMTGNAFDRMMSRWEQMLGYSLTSSDRTFRGAIEAEQLRGLENFDNLTDEERQALAKNMADYRLFQNHGLAYRIAKGAHDVMNVAGFGGQMGQTGRQGGFGLGDLVMPYPGVPANLWAKALEYSPANVVKGTAEMVKLLQDVKTGKSWSVTQQQNAVMDVARGLHGTALIVGLAALFRAGIIRNADDEEDPDAKALAAAEGRQGVQINLSAALRWAQGGSREWQKGDKLMKIDWLEPMNAFLAIASLAADDLDNPGAYMMDTMEGSAQALLDMPVMTSIANIMDSYNYSKADTTGGKMAETAINFGVDSLTGLLPAPISQAARAMDPYYRETAGDTAAETALNRVMNAIPGLRQMLDPKLDNFGMPKENPESAYDRWMNSFVRPGQIGEYKAGEMEQALDALAERTGDPDVYPDRKAPSSFTINGEKVQMDNDQKQFYQAVYGQTCEKYYNTVLNGEDYADLSDAEKSWLLEEVRTYAKYKAQQAVAGGMGRNDYENKQGRKLDNVLRSGVDLPGYLLGQKNANADGEGSLKNTEVFDWLWNSDYTEKQQAAIWNANRGSSNKSWADYKAANPVAILADFGIQGRQAQRIASAIDPGWSSVSSFSQEELWNYYKAHPDQEEAIAALWDAKGGSTSWADYRRKHG